MEGTGKMGGCSWEDYLTTDERESRLWSPQIDFKVPIAWRGLLAKKLTPGSPQAAFWPCPRRVRSWRFQEGAKSTVNIGKHLDALFVFKFGDVVWRAVVVVVFEIRLQPPFIQLTTTPSTTALSVISSNRCGRNVWITIIVSPSGFLKDQVEFLFVSPCLPSSSPSGKTYWFVKLQYQQAKPKVQLKTLRTENSIKKSGWWLRESLVELWSNL